MRSNPQFTIAIVVLPLALVLAACAPDPDTIPPPIEYLQGPDDIDAIDPMPHTHVHSIAPPPGKLGLCTLEARAAALVDVLDQHGHRLDGISQDIELLWRVWSPEDGWSDVQPGFCVGDPCDRWAIGFEQPGRYVVAASGCGDEIARRFDVGMTEDGCHVDTQHVRVQFEEATLEATGACTIEPTLPVEPAEPVEPVEGGMSELATPCIGGERSEPAVIALTGVQNFDVMLPWTPDKIHLLPEGGELRPMDCLDNECTQWIGGSGQSGAFRVQAAICGRWVSTDVEVERSEDGCGVQTQWVILIAEDAGCVTDDWMPPP